jgi:hypothetical protein
VSRGDRAAQTAVAHRPNEKYRNQDQGAFVARLPSQVFPEFVMIGAHPVPAFNPRDTMQKPDKIDYAKLLGFDAVATTFQTASTSKTRPSVPGSAPR